MGFNILGPLQNQLNAMSDAAPAAKGRKRGVAAGLGLTAAGLMATQSAEAAQQVADLAASDNRFGTIALLAVPVLGWVGFNILGEWSAVRLGLGFTVACVDACHVALPADLAPPCAFTAAGPLQNQLNAMSDAAPAKGPVKGRKK